MNVDSRVSAILDGRLKQVFVYLTSRCQLRCKQCLYKPLLSPIYDDIPFDKLIELLQQFHRYGAFKLSFLGGEPTLYYDSKSGKRFGDVIRAGKEIGYAMVRADTNGQFDNALLEDENVTKIDEFTFSLDGTCAEIHDEIRGKNGAFSNCISRIKQAVSLGYKVQITTCVHGNACKNPDNGVSEIEKMIQLCDSLGVSSLNFHPILKVGVPRDGWIEDTEIDPYVWLDVYKKMQTRLESLPHIVQVRIPMRYVEREKYKKEHAYCPLRMGERVLIMPDGQLKICAFTIGTQTCFARYSEEGITYARQHTH